MKKITTYVCFLIGSFEMSKSKTKYLWIMFYYYYCGLHDRFWKIISEERDLKEQIFLLKVDILPPHLPRLHRLPSVARASPDLRRFAAATTTTFSATFLLRRSTLKLSTSTLLLRWHSMIWVGRRCTAFWDQKPDLFMLKNVKPFKVKSKIIIFLTIFFLIVTVMSCLCWRDP